MIWSAMSILPQSGLPPVAGCFLAGHVITIVHMPQTVNTFYQIILFINCRLPRNTPSNIGPRTRQHPRYALSATVSVLLKLSDRLAVSVDFLDQLMPLRVSMRQPAQRPIYPSRLIVRQTGSRHLPPLKPARRYLVRVVHVRRAVDPSPLIVHIERHADVGIDHIDSVKQHIPPYRQSTPTQKATQRGQNGSWCDFRRSTLLMA